MTFFASFGKASTGLSRRVGSSWSWALCVLMLCGQASGEASGQANTEVSGEASGEVDAVAPAVSQTQSEAENPRAPEATNQHQGAAQQDARGSSKRVVTLSRCLSLAEQNYGSVREARARLAMVEAQLDEARTTPFSNFQSTAGVAVAPTLRGTALYSPSSDIALSQNMALGWQVNLKGTVPLWTFGKITSVVDAAEAQVGLKQHEVAKAKNEVRLSVKKAYYGVLFARDALVLVRDAESRIDKALAKLVVRIANEDADEAGLYKMRMYRAELKARENEVLKQQAVALAGLKVLTGSEDPVDVVDMPLPPANPHLAPLNHYLGVARANRPELAMARAGVEAREAQVESQKASYYPDIGVTFQAGWSQAPEITDQVNPFVRDPANFLRYGLSLGMQWKMDFLPKGARLAQAESRLEEVRATEQFAESGVAMEVETAYMQAVHTGRQVAAFEAAAENARKWLISVQQGVDIGAVEADAVVTPAKEYAMKRFSLMNATYEHHLALARLALATGTDVAAIGP